MASRCVIAANWKMHKTRGEARWLWEALVAGAGQVPVERELVLFPSSTALSTLAEAARGTRFAIGAQNLHPGREGAVTGEVSGRQLAEAGASHVLIGHSERRRLFAESDALLAEKMEAALEYGLAPIFCVGETLEERDRDETWSTLRRQLERGLGRLSAPDWTRVCLAYEPVWAIGTGRTATEAQAREAHAFLRTELARLAGEATAALPILYGGSVRPENAGALLGSPEIQGLLVGGASLEAESFLAIAAA